MSDIVKILKKYKNSNIALSGLGIETQKLLGRLGEEYSIAGLLDGYKEDGTLYGRRIISFAEAVRCQVKLILVVARPGSCKAIAKRIKKDCLENGIALWDVRGNNLCEEQRVSYDFADVSEITKKQLSEEICKNEVVSIDLFDTLIMRNTLFVTDLFEILDAKLKNRGIEIPDFTRKRMSCEKELSGSGAPTLREIYCKLLGENNIQEIGADELAGLEWETDYDALVPRKEMCNFIKEIRESGTDVYITSDTYYSRYQIAKILKKCGIDFYTDLLLSCEYRTGKQEALFEKLKERTGGKACIHIGDDTVADIDSARAHGLHACRIYSGIDLFEMVGYFGMWDYIESLADRLKAGMFLAKLFNDPFQFETQEKKIEVRNAYEIGYLFMAPMIADFIIWFREQVEQNQLKNIWFCARDGYLIKRLYERLTGEERAVYFLTSRTAAIRAGVQCEEDIQYVESMKFSGSVRMQLHKRFGITDDSEEEDREEGQGGLLRYSGLILQKAAEARRNYLRYIEQLSVDEGEIAFFDFVAKGTSQMFIGHIVPNPLRGLYFLQLEKENMAEQCLDIVSFYDADDLKDSAIYEDY